MIHISVMSAMLKRIYKSTSVQAVDAILIVSTTGNDIEGIALMQQNMSFLVDFTR